MTLLFAFPEQAALGASLVTASGFEQGVWEWRNFPDGESYVRVLSDAKAKPAIILCSLNQPNEKILPLLFLARTLKEFGSGKITLIAPYLGYMRQDKRFNEGEAVTSAVFAKLLSGYVDALITVDPHLHRHTRLEETYTCECRTVSAASLMSQWIAANVKNPIVIGPDKESEQWAKDVAGQANAPYIILLKTRHGDREVDIIMPDIQRYKKHTPVLIDDIISTAATMMKAADSLRQQGFERIACVATHGVFAQGAYENLLKTRGIEVVTSNTIPHSSNGIDVGTLLVTPNIRVE